MRIDAPNATLQASASPSLWKLILGMTISPGAVLAGGARPASPLRGLAIAVLAFALFFGLSGLESDGAGAAFGFALLGAALGAVGVVAAAAGAWGASRILGCPRQMGWCVAAFGAAYAPMLIHAGAGLFFNLALGWNAAVAFGASGLLWSVRPLFAASSGALGDRPWSGLVLATVCGGAGLLLWAACFGGF